MKIIVFFLADIMKILYLRKWNMIPKTTKA